MAPLAVQSSPFTTDEHIPIMLILNPLDTKNNDDSNSSSIIEEDSPLGPYDVLCGRDKMALNNVGNRRFRITISMNLKAYDDAKTRTEKSVLIATIVQYLQDEAGVRFLKKKSSVNGRTGYVELNAKQAREKVGHCLRDMSSATRRKENNRSRSPSPAPPSLPPRSNSPVPRVVSSSSITESKQHQEQYDFEPIPI